jgi:hypothetical protein
MMHRCTHCGRTWPLYDPRTLLGGLRGILRVPMMAFHVRRCRRRMLRELTRTVGEERARAAADRY